MDGYPCREKRYRRNRYRKTCKNIQFVYKLVNTGVHWERDLQIVERRWQKWRHSNLSIKIYRRYQANGCMCPAWKPPSGSKLCRPIGGSDFYESTAFPNVCSEPCFIISSFLRPYEIPHARHYPDLFARFISVRTPCSHRTTSCN